MKWVAFGVLFGSSLLWAGSGPKRPQTLLITNVNVVDTRYGGIHPNMAITIEDGIIKAVTKIAIVNAGPHVRVVNDSGLFILPGLWDMGAHLGGMSEAPGQRAAFFELYVANGITGVRDLDSSMDSGLTKADDVRPELEPMRPVWMAQQPVTSDGWIRGRRALDDLPEILAVCSLIGQENKSRLTENTEVHTSVCSPENARRLSEEIRDHGAWIVPSLAGTEAAGQASAKQLMSKLRSVDDGPRPGRDLDLQRSSEVVHELQSFGAQFLAGTNASPRNATTWIPVQRELELMVASGLCPLEALQAATYNAALYMGKLNRYGVVEPAHIANLLVLDGNPLEDIHNARNVVAVVLRGQYFSRTELDAMLAHAHGEFRGVEDAAVPATTRQ